MKVTLVIKVSRFCKQILSMRLLCLHFSSIDVQNLHNQGHLHNPNTYVNYILNWL